MTQEFHGMWCSKCNGRVMVDRMFQGGTKKKASEKNHIELFCMLCGKRWMLNKTKNRLAAWLTEQEAILANEYAISSSR